MEVIPSVAIDSRCSFLEPVFAIAQWQVRSPRDFELLTTPPLPREKNTGEQKPQRSERFETKPATKKNMGL